MWYSRRNTDNDDDDEIFKGVAKIDFGANTSRIQHFLKNGNNF